MARASLVALLLLAAVAGTLASSRGLMQSGNNRCPDGCDPNGGCVRDTTTGGYRCIKCLNTLIVMRDTGRCGCAKGRYALGSGTGSDDCGDCVVGAFCPGGEYVKSTVAPASQDCPDKGTKMTTLGTRSISNQQCVNMPGFSYAYNTASNTPSATACPQDTYSAGLRKQPSCTPCGPGLTTGAGVTGSDEATDCVLKAGYYLRAPGVAAVCPKGEYYAGGALVSKCTKCADGITTEFEGSDAITDCTVLLPGYEALTNTGAQVTSTQLCQQDYWCPGGNLTTINAISGAVSSKGKVLCHDGTMTKTFGASSNNECLVPPGYSKSSTAITNCSDGYYREGWVFKDDASSLLCDSCGSGFHSQSTETIARWDSSNAVAASIRTPGAKGSCYIDQGMGSYQTPSGAFYAIACVNNNYGVATAAFGLNTNPCRDCPANMVTNTNAPSVEWKSLTGWGNGYYDPKACVTQPGYGYNGRISTVCQQGYYNGGDNYDQCQKCPYGTTTVVGTPATDQNSQSDCFIAPGFGLEDNVIRTCPVGEYNDVIRSDTTSPCTACPTGSTTTEEGASQAVTTSCNVCAAGYGGVNLAACTAAADAGKCGGGVVATYGPAGRDPATTACSACPTMTQGFSFDWNQAPQMYTPNPVARLGADQISDCLAEFTQVEDNIWELTSTAITGELNATATSVTACASACRTAATSCLWFTFDYSVATNLACKLYKGAAGTTQYTGFKAAPAGDLVATTSLKKTALASGRYTWYKMGTADIGTQIRSEGASGVTVDACQKACNLEPTCAAVVMTGLTGTADTSTGSCSLRQGSNTVDTGRRSLTITRVGQLSVATAGVVA